MIGTPFEIKNDEIHNKRIAKLDRKENEEFALNEKGQRRFHGAFTGGFHAGYNNTVGSQAGFKPAQYDPKKKYTVFDIMDEEDLGDHVNGQTIQTKDEYGHFADANTMAAQQLGQSVFGGVIPDELVIAPKSTIGYKLLRQLGWNERARKVNNVQVEDEDIQSEESIDFDKMEGVDVSDFIDENIGSAHVSYSHQPNLDEQTKHKKDIQIKQKIDKVTKSKVKKPKIKIDHENYYKGVLKFKKDKFGLGYIPSSTDYLLEKKKREGMKGEEADNRLDMGKLNFDGDVYQQEDKQDLEMIDADNQHAQDHVEDKKMQDLFKDRREEKNDLYAAGFNVSLEMDFRDVEVPKDYDPFWRKMQTNSHETNQAVALRRRKLNANMRAQILGEQKSGSKLESNFDEGVTMNQAQPKENLT